MTPAFPEPSHEQAAAAVERMPLIDALKGVAAQLILLHHLVSYGPLAEAANRLLPALSGWLYDYGRMAVQVFLVVAGFLAARALAPDGAPAALKPLPLIWRRYARLAPPFLVSILLAVAAAAVARGSVGGDMVPAAPTAAELLAYVVFLHSLLGVPSLSTGVWYVPVDLQLYALLVALFWLCGRAGEGRRAALASAGVALLALASLFSFNRDAGLDNWGLYFFYAYALGVFAWWLSDRARSPWGLLAVTAVVVIALLFDFRLRVALALAVALLLALARRRGWLQRWPDSALLGYLGRISFSVFLVHFPVFMLVSAGYVRLGAAGDAAAVLALLFAWGSATAAGAFFFRHVESRRRWLPARWRAAFSTGRR